MRALLSIATLLLPLLAAAGVYRWVDPDGRIQYSDRPVSGAERVGIQLDRSVESAEAQVPTEEGGLELGTYDSFEILAPEPNQTLRDAEGKVDLSLLIEPPLAPDHRLQILVDGQPVTGDAQGAQIQLLGLAFGSHRIQARIKDDLDETVATSTAIDFHLRKPLPEDLRPDSP